MRLIFVYGPPAAGKLTVALALAQATGYRVLHNHLVNDLAEAVFAPSTPQYGQLTRRLRFEMLELALEHDVSLISTLVYAAPHDDLYVQEVREFVESRGGACAFVQLVCRPETLLRRVGDESRRRFGKIKDVQVLERLLQKYELFMPVPWADSLQVDTDELSPAEAARAIVDYIGGAP